MTRPASSPFPPTLREMDRDSRTAAAGTGLRRQPSFTCAGCGTPLPPSRVGRPRKWCSERCRKDQYAGVCEVCGGPTDGTTPSRGVAKVCHSCREWPEEAIIDAIRRWADEHGGLPPTAFDWRVAQDGYPQAACAAVRRAGWNNLLLRAGFGLRCDRRPETQAWIEQQLRAGRPVSEIAAALGVTDHAIHKRMHNRGTTVVKVRAAA